MVQINKKSILWLLTILTIGAFFLEFFVVIMWAPQQQDTTATPTPAASQTFTGTGYMQATVTGFDDNMLIECNNSASATAAALEGVNGILRAFLASDTIIAAKLNGTFSSAEFVPIADSINSTLSRWCAPKIVRGALLKIEAPLTAFGTSSNATVYPRELEAYASYAGQRAPTGFVNAGTAENESIQLVASISTQQGQVVQFFAQQVEIQAATATPQAGQNETFTVEKASATASAPAANNS